MSTTINDRMSQLRNLLSSNPHADIEMAEVGMNGLKCIL